jgi:hypothetical protein
MIDDGTECWEIDNCHRATEMFTEEPLTTALLPETWLRKDSGPWTQEPETEFLSCDEDKICLRMILPSVSVSQTWSSFLTISS